jgi:hypothetical protein
MRRQRMTGFEASQEGCRRLAEEELVGMGLEARVTMAGVCCSGGAGCGESRVRTWR